MKIKKYYAKTLSDALKQAKLEFGDGVVILESRRIRSSIFLKRKNDLVEISVAVNDDNKKNRGLDIGGSFRRIVNDNQKYLKKHVTSTRSQFNSDLNRDGTVTNEMTILRHELNKLNRRLRKMTPPDFPEPFSKVREKLSETGISDEDAITFVRRSYLRLENNSEVTQEKVLESVKSEILPIFHQSSSFGKSDEEKPKSENDRGKAKLLDSVKSEVITLFMKDDSLKQIDRKIPKIVTVVGPTGVGKTTTLMKLAAHPEIYGKENVTIVSTDTYRMAAAESLKAFSEITSIPIMEVKDPKNARTEIDKLSDMDIILVDMPGRSPLFPNYIQELQDCLLSIGPTDILLVLSATADLEDLCYSAGLYRTLSPTGIIFTKIDETTRPGKLVSIMQEVDLPVSYITNGQSIPIDIRDGDGEFIWERILNSMQGKIQ
ncbi:MAG: hypothetical protein KAX28_01685 [Candidatus Marinimicrobia bacterium]|nr:hypothetical protein [Candidatus Neomarinimicrobiota bacterium]